MPELEKHLECAVFLVGILLVSYLNKYVAINELVFGVPVVFLYSVGADLDSYSSKIRTFALCCSIAGIVLLYQIEKKFWAILLAVVTVFILVQRHRGLMHSFFSGLILAMPLYLTLGIRVFLIAFIAYICHLILDDSFKLI